MTALGTILAPYYFISKSMTPIFSLADEETGQVLINTRLFIYDLPVIVAYEPILAHGGECDVD